VSVWAALDAPCPPTIHEADRGHGPSRPSASIGAEGLHVGETVNTSMLGVLAPDRIRSVVVVSDDGELAVAVREVVPPEIAVVRDARPDDAAAIAAACLPWPWMVVGAAAVSREMATVLRERPVLALWLGSPPPGLPDTVRRFDRPAALLDSVAATCNAEVGGMRLAPGSGVELHDGTLFRGASLEALIGAHPGSIALSSRAFRTISDVLARHDVAWTPAREGALVTLARATAMTVRS